MLKGNLITALEKNARGKPGEKRKTSFLATGSNETLNRKMLGDNRADTLGTNFSMAV